MKDNKKNKFLKSITKYLIELCIVAFGVYLGFYLSDKNTRKKNDLNTQNALAQIIFEFEHNEKKLETAINYHKKISASLDSIKKESGIEKSKIPIGDNNEFDHNIIPEWTGVGIALLRKNVYESCKINGVFRNLNISTINLLSIVYERIDLYSEFSKRNLYNLLDTNSDTKTRDFIKGLDMIVKEDVAKMEIGLLKLLKENKERLKEKIAAKAYSK